MKKIKISIILPIYNSEKYLRKCLDSILGQSLKEIEVIAINDGSSDKSLDILNSYIDGRLSIINQKNLGVSYARNKGLEISTGKYIICLDSDDWIEKNYLYEIYKEAEKRQLDILISDYFLDIGEDSFYKEDIKQNELEIISGEKYIASFFKKNLQGFNVNKLFKRDIIEYNNISYDEKVTFMEDTLFLMKIAKKATRIGKINKAYYHYVQHADNTTKKIKIKHLESVEIVFDNLKIEFKNNKQILSLINEKEVNCLCWGIFNLKDKEKNSNIIEKFLKKLKSNKTNLIKEKKIIKKIIKLFPFKITIKLLKLLYNLKK